MLYSIFKTTGSHGYMLKLFFLYLDFGFDAVLFKMSAFGLMMGLLCVVCIYIYIDECGFFSIFTFTIVKKKEIADF